MVFCLPISIDRIGAAPDGSIIVEGRQVCWGTEVPAPDLPDIDLTPPDADLPETTLPETGPDIVAPGDALTGPDVETQSETETEEDVCTEGCEACSAARMGHAAWVNYAPDNAEYHEESTWQGYRYQAHVCGLPHDPVGGRIQEWQFVAYSWDGFEHATCRMLEAKWGYSGLLESFYVTVDGDPRRRTKPKPGFEELARGRFGRLLFQAGNQKARLSQFPEVGLLWMFAHFDSYIFFSTVGGNALGIDVEHRSGPSG